MLDLITRNPLILLCIMWVLKMTIIVDALTSPDEFFAVEGVLAMFFIAAIFELLIYGQFYRDASLRSKQIFVAIVGSPFAIYILIAIPLYILLALI